MTVLWVVLGGVYAAVALWMFGVGRGLIDKAREDGTRLPGWHRFVYLVVGTLLWPVLVAFGGLQRLFRAGREAGKA